MGITFLLLCGFSSCGDRGDGERQPTTKRSTRSRGDVLVWFIGTPDREEEENEREREREREKDENTHEIHNQEATTGSLQGNHRRQGEINLQINK
jgi:hypothetical protein